MTHTSPPVHSHDLYWLCKYCIVQWIMTLWYEWVIMLTCLEMLPPSVRLTRWSWTRAVKRVCVWWRVTKPHSQPTSQLHPISRFATIPHTLLHPTIRSHIFNQWSLVDVRQTSPPSTPVPPCLSHWWMCCGLCPVGDSSSVLVRLLPSTMSSSQTSLPSTSVPPSVRLTR